MPRRRHCLRHHLRTSTRLKHSNFCHEPTAYSENNFIFIFVLCVWRKLCPMSLPFAKTIFNYYIFEPSTWSIYATSNLIARTASYEWTRQLLPRTTVNHYIIKPNGILNRRLWRCGKKICIAEQIDSVESTELKYIKFKRRRCYVNCPTDLYDERFIEIGGRGHLAWVNDFVGTVLSPVFSLLHYKICCWGRRNYKRFRYAPT